MIVNSKNIPQFIDELNIEVEQIKKELRQTITNVEYASEYSEGVKLGDLLVGSQSTQVIAPQITMTAGPESGQFFLELPVGTESALTLPVGTESGQIVRPEVQNDANAASLVPDALLTGRTVESFLNSNIATRQIVSFSTDGTTSFKDLLNSIYTPLKNFLESIEPKDYMRVCGIFVREDTIVQRWSLARMILYTGEIVFINSFGDALATYDEVFNITGDTNTTYSAHSYDTSGNTVIDKSSTVGASGASFTVYFDPIL